MNLKKWRLSKWALPNLTSFLKADIVLWLVEKRKRQTPVGSEESKHHTVTCLGRWNGKDLRGTSRSWEPPAKKWGRLQWQGTEFCQQEKNLEEGTFPRASRQGSAWPTPWLLPCATLSREPSHVLQTSDLQVRELINECCFMLSVWYYLNKTMDTNRVPQEMGVLIGLRRSLT